MFSRYSKMFLNVFRCSHIFSGRSHDLLMMSLGILKGLEDLMVLVGLVCLGVSLRFSLDRLLCTLYIVYYCALVNSPSLDYVAEYFFKETRGGYSLCHEAIFP